MTKIIDMTKIKNVPVSIEFTPHSFGGRKAEPTGDQYACNTIIDGLGWSVIIDLVQSPPMMGFLSYLAPSHLLVPGFTIRLCEGDRIVGMALCLGKLFECPICSGGHKKLDYYPFCDLCARKFCSEECADLSDCDDDMGVKGGGIYWCVLCKNNAQKREMLE